MALRMLSASPLHPIIPKVQSRLIADVPSGMAAAKPLRRNARMVARSTPADSGAKVVRSLNRLDFSSALMRGAPTWKASAKCVRAGAMIASMALYALRSKSSSSRSSAMLTFKATARPSAEMWLPTSSGFFSATSRASAIASGLCGTPARTGRVSTFPPALRMVPTLKRLSTFSTKASSASAWWSFSNRASFSVVHRSGSRTNTMVLLSEPNSLEIRS